MFVFGNVQEKPGSETGLSGFGFDFQPRRVENDFSGLQDFDPEAGFGFGPVLGVVRNPGNGLDLNDVDVDAEL